jgi:hypothetical protein
MRILILAFMLICTGCSKEWFDMAEPVITAFSPADRSQGLSLKPEIYIEFSKEMDMLKSEKAFSITGGIAAVKGNFRWSGNRLYFDIAGNLENGTEYRITLNGSAEDSNGNNIKSDFTSSFIPGNDLIQPSVLSFSAERNFENGIVNIPVTDGMPGVSKMDTIVIEFSEPVTRDSVFENVTVSPAVLLQKEISGTRLRLIPYEGFVNGTKYTVSVKSGVTDLSGNKLRSEKSVSFLCGNDFTKPGLSPGGEVICLGSNSVLQPSALNSGIVEKNSTIRIKFSEPMDRLSASDSISISPAVAYDLVWSADYISVEIRLKNNSVYLLDKVYSLTVDDTARDISGNSLDSQYNYFFRINGPDSKPVSVSGLYQMKPDADGNILSSGFNNISLPYSVIDLSGDFYYQADKNPLPDVTETVNLFVIRIKFQSTSENINLRKIDYISAVESIQFSDAGYHGTSSTYIQPSVYKISIPQSDPYSADIHLYNLEPGHYYRLDIKGGTDGIKDSYGGDSGNWMLDDFKAILSI